MQIAGRPFQDPLVLRIGDAYEHATSWRSRRPKLVQGALHPPIELTPNPPSPPLDSRMKTFIECSVEQAGLTLDDEQMELLYQAAPFALAMARRVSSSNGWAVEPASTFRLD